MKYTRIWLEQRHNLHTVFSISVLNYVSPLLWTVSSCCVAGVVEVLLNRFHFIYLPLKEASSFVYWTLHSFTRHDLRSEFHSTFNLCHANSIRKMSLYCSQTGSTKFHLLFLFSSFKARKKHFQNNLLLLYLSDFFRFAFSHTLMSLIGPQIVLHCILTQKFNKKKEFHNGFTHQSRTVLWW